MEIFCVFPFMVGRPRAETPSFFRAPGRAFRRGPRRTVRPTFRAQPPSGDVSGSTPRPTTFEPVASVEGSATFRARRRSTS